MLRFDNRVVVVTGAAGALGSAYCRYYAERGAAIVVNDIPPKPGQVRSGAEALVDELKSKGGKAVADHHDVTDGESIIKTAIDSFGRVDIVINNAGILQDVSFAKMSKEQWDRIMQVHLNGAFSVTHAAWPHMLKQKYGRIIMTSSAAGLYGNFGQANYSAAKLALVGFASALAKEGKKHNILVNTIAPIAGSPMTRTVMPESLVEALKPAYVAPVVLKLTHETNTDTGKIFEVGGGWVGQVRWQRSKGVAFSLAENGKYLTPELVQSKWSSVCDFSGETENPTDPQDSFTVVMNNLSSAEEKGSAELAAAAGLSQPKPASTGSAAGVPSKGLSQEIAKNPEQQQYEKDFKSARVFRILADFITPELIKQVKGIFAFELTNEQGKTARWVVDLKNPPGKLYVGREGQDVKPNTTLILSDENFMKAVNKEVQPQALYISGRLKVKGSLPLAMKFETVTKPLEDLARSML